MDRHNAQFSWRLKGTIWPRLLLRRQELDLAAWGVILYSLGSINHMAAHTRRQGRSPDFPSAEYRMQRDPDQRNPVKKVLVLVSGDGGAQFSPRSLVPPRVKAATVISFLTIPLSCIITLSAPAGMVRRHNATAAWSRISSPHLRTLIAQAAPEGKPWLRWRPVSRNTLK